MALVDALIGALRGVDANAKVALAAECADRVEPVYEEYWVGSYSPFIRRSVELSWAYACGEPIDEAEYRKCLAHAEEFVGFYREEGIDVLAASVTVVLRALQAMNKDEAASTLAVARALVSARGTAQSAEAMVNLHLPKEDRSEVAMREEESWQNAALSLLRRWSGAPARDMFDPLNDKPPRWFEDWKVRSRR